MPLIWQVNVMDTQKRLHENISAMTDGELSPHEVELAFAALNTPEGRVAWDAYHQIGDTLRCTGTGGELSPDFPVRLAARLATEAHAERSGLLYFDHGADAGMELRSIGSGNATSLG
jgi:sigma-E factor negative regulatory protein RseA